MPSGERAAPAPQARPRRVLISGGLAAGGMQTHVTLLCTLLRQAGAEVTIASASSAWKPDELAKVRQLGVSIMASPFRFGRWQLLSKLWAIAHWSLFLRRDFDVLYCIGEGRMHFWARRFVREGAFQIYHEIVDCSPAVWTAARLAGQMDGLIANSAQVARQLAGRFPDLPIRIIPFCTSDGPMPLPPPRGAVGRRELRIAYLGRIVPHKRPAELLESFISLQDQAPLSPARLDLYGSDHEGLEDQLKERVRLSGLAGKITFHGAYQTADLDRIFAQTDLVVLPSRYEGLPLVLVEAMQRGVPVVATSAGGTAELGLDNPDVAITPGTDWAAFEEGLLALAGKIRSGQIDSARLHAWTESRYGYETVSALWCQALLQPGLFFAREAVEPAVV